MIKIERVITFELYSMIKLIVPLLSSYYLLIYVNSDLHFSVTSIVLAVQSIEKKITSVRSCFK